MSAPDLVNHHGFSRNRLTGGQLRRFTSAPLAPGPGSHHASAGEGSVVYLQLDREGLVEADGGELGGAVVGEPAHALHAGQAGNVHHVTLLVGDHVRQERLARLQNRTRRTLGQQGNN